MFDPSKPRCLSVPIKGACGPSISCHRVPSKLVRGYVVVILEGIEIPLHACEAEKLIADLAREIAMLDAEKEAKP